MTILQNTKSSCCLVWVLCDFHIFSSLGHFCVSSIFSFPGRFCMTSLFFHFGPLFCDFHIFSLFGRFPAVDHCTELTVVQPENDETYQKGGHFCQWNRILVIRKKWKLVIVAKLYDSYLSSPLESNFVNAS